MSYFVYVTEECRRDLGRHGMEDGVERVKDKLEREQSASSLDRFPAPFLKKRLGRTRLLIEERLLGDEHVLLCFVRLVFRGDAAYRAFLDGPDSIRKTYTLDETALAAYVQQRLATHVPARLPLEPREEGYLFNPTLVHADQGLVLETRAWVERMLEPARSPYLSAYAEVVDHAIWDKEDGEVRRSASQNRVAVLFRRLPHLNATILIAPVDSAQDEEALRSAHARMLSDADFDTDELRRECRRSYPAIITADPALWIETQRSTEANLALSPEESTILEALRGGASAGGSGEAYPLFINGRPGSGKSTILQYLFADQLYFHLTRSGDERTPQAPIYLTYSGDLCARARTVAQSILECDASKIAEHRLTAAEIRDVLPTCFQTFRGFLSSQLPIAVKGQFLPARYVDFRRFRSLWEAQFGRAPDRQMREMGAELAWHVIRTFIKGLRQEDGEYFDVDSYAEHPAKRKSVSEPTFRLVFERVWDKWYRPLCEREQWWDDQDLARGVLDSGVDLARYPAVFCDEAQDFTKLELELILNLSLYSKRKVPPHLLSRVPFAFAGDPFQTLNPTGFYWEAVRADFHENIVANLDRSPSRTLALNFKELEFNYRSAEPIVKVCNAIQCARGIAFGIPALTPQKTWFTDPAAVPVFYRDDDAVCRAKLEAHEEVVIIVPCHEGGELDYVRADPLLSGIAIREGSLARNVLSAMRAKGLEFTRVVLYKFGADPAAREFMEALQGEASHAKPREETLESEYFVNRLYVAASRARSRLIVVDTQDALTNFWSFACVAAEGASLVETYRAVFGKAASYPWSVEDVGRIVEGTTESWEQSRDAPIDLANKFLQQGKSQRDPYFLERAESLFRTLHDSLKADYCKALSLEFSDKPREAGAHYASLSRHEDAVRCFWAARAYDALAALDEPNVRASPEGRAAAFEDSARDWRACDTYVASLFAHLGEDELRARILSSEQWQEVLRDVVDALGRAAGASDSAAARDWSRIHAQLSACEKFGAFVPQTLARARVAFCAGDMHRAAAIWRASEASGKAKEVWVVEALAEAEDYPSCLQHIAELGQWERAFRLFDERRQSKLSARDAQFVLESCLQTGRVADAWRFLRRGADAEQLKRLLNALDASSDPGLAQQVAEAYLDALDKESKWSPAISLVVSGRTEGGAVAGAEPGLDRKRLSMFLLKRLSTSAHLADATVDSRKMVSEFLRRQVTAAKDPSELGVTAYELGAAFERAGTFTDSLAFYEFVARGQWGPERELERFARERWLLNKQRQGARFRQDRKLERANQIDDELKRQSQVWDIPLDRLRHLPRFPEPHRDESGSGTAVGTPVIGAQQADSRVQLAIAEGDASTQPQLADEAVPELEAPPPAQHVKVSLTFSIGGRVFEGTLLADARRLELRDVATQHVIAIRGAQADVRSVDLDDIVEEKQGDAHTCWEIRQWGIVCMLSAVISSLRVDVVASGARVFSVLL